MKNETIIIWVREEVICWVSIATDKRMQKFCAKISICVFGGSLHFILEYFLIYLIYWISMKFKNLKFKTNFKGIFLSAKEGKET